MTSPIASDAASSPVEAPESPQDRVSAPTPSQPTSNAPEASESQESYLETVKKNLEYAIAGKRATVRLHGTIIEFQRWGLQKRMSLGTRVIGLVQKLRVLIPGLDQEDMGEGTLTLLLQALSYMTEDVIEILSRSVSSPWKNPNDAVKWIDENCELEDLFDLCVIVYEMNLRGELLGKLQSSADNLGRRMTSLLKSSSKS